MWLNRKSHWWFESEVIGEKKVKDKSKSWASVLSSNQMWELPTCVVHWRTAEVSINMLSTAKLALWPLTLSPSRWKEDFFFFLPLACSTLLTGLSQSAAAISWPSALHPLLSQQLVWPPAALLLLLTLSHILALMPPVWPASPPIHRRQKRECVEPVWTRGLTDVLLVCKSQAWRSTQSVTWIQRSTMRPWELLSEDDWGMYLLL